VRIRARRTLLTIIFAFLAEQEKKIKGWINLRGYKILSIKDGNGFKMVHDVKPAHQFSSEDKVLVQNWIKALIKATISRNLTGSVSFCWLCIVNPGLTFTVLQQTPSTSLRKSTPYHSKKLRQ
jgi:hypothetical protein